MDHLPVNGLDLAVGIILLVSALLAFMRGFVQETLSVAAWIGASFGAIYGLKYVQPTARRLIPLDWAADLAGMAVLFLTILLVLSLLINLISRTVQRSGLNPLDRSLGFVFGLVRGGVILCVALIICDWLVTPDNRPDWMRTAKTLPLMENGAEALKGLLPHTFQRAGDAAKDAAARLDEAAETAQTLQRLTEPVPKRPGGNKKQVQTAQPTADEIGRKVEELLGTAEQNGAAPAGTGHE
jgi:membrane protein required for colicin V production